MEINFILHSAQNVLVFQHLRLRLTRVLIFFSRQICVCIDLTLSAKIEQEKKCNLYSKIIIYDFKILEILLQS